MAPQDIDAVNTAVNAARTAGASPADMWKVVKAAGWSPDAYVKAVAAQKAIRNVAAPAPADAAAGAGATGDAAAAAAAPAPGVDPSGNSPTGALQAFGHGASMGASDNVGGLVDAIVNRAQDPGSAVDMPTIRARIADRKASRAGFESAHPIAGGALELAGGIMTGGGVNKALASGVERVAGSKAAALLTMKAGQYGRNILRGGAQGTAYGAAVGANDAAPGDTMDGAEMGGLVGAAGGMAFGALAPAGVAAAQKIGGGVQSLYNYASGMLNPAVAARNFASRAPVGINPLLDAMGRAGKTPADLRASLQDANAMGAQDSIATASQPGGSVQQLAKRSVIQPGPGKDIGRAAIADSTAAIRPQIESNIESATGLPVQDSSAEVAQRMAQRKGTSSANYGALPTDPINDPALIQRLDSNPAYRRAHEAYMTAHNSSAERGTEVTPMWSTVVDSQGKSSVELTRAPTQQDLDGISRVVKGQADNAKASARSGTDTSGTSGVETANLGKANSSLLDLVHGTENSASVAPELSAAKTSHRTSSEVIDAMMAGRDTHMAGSNARPFETAAAVGKLSPEAKVGYQKGAVAAINDRMGAATDTGASLTKEVIGKTGTGTKSGMLKATFGDTSKVGELIDRITGLAKREQVANLVNGNSSTAENQATMGDKAIDGGLSMLKKGGLHSVLDWMGDAVMAARGKYNSSVNESIAGEVFTPRAGDKADSFLKFLDQAHAARKAKSNLYARAASRAGAAGAALRSATE